MIADTFTKPLARFKFEKFRKLLGIIWSCVVLEGECWYFILFRSIYIIISLSAFERLHRASPYSLINILWLIILQLEIPVFVVMRLDLMTPLTPFIIFFPLCKECVVVP
jgi:hypothetical protein